MVVGSLLPIRIWPLQPCVGQSGTCRGLAGAECRRSLPLCFPLDVGQRWLPVLNPLPFLFWIKSSEGERSQPPQNFHVKPPRNGGLPALRLCLINKRMALSGELWKTRSSSGGGPSLLRAFGAGKVRGDVHGDPCAVQVSNLRPPACEAGALPLS